jgi:transcriptional regulator of met regulon
MRQVDYEHGKTLSLSAQHSKHQKGQEKISVKIPVKALNIGWERNRGGILTNCESLSLLDITPSAMLLDF